MSNAAITQLSGTLFWWLGIGGRCSCLCCCELEWGGVDPDLIVIIQNRFAVAAILLFNMPLYSMNKGEDIYG